MNFAVLEGTAFPRSKPSTVQANRKGTTSLAAHSAGPRAVARRETAAIEPAKHHSVQKMGFTNPSQLDHHICTGTILEMIPEF